jgi:hypothetical protein
MNCHAQIWTNAAILEPVRHSWATGESIPWIRIHDLPDYVYFNHEIHVNKGIGCATCHGRVDQMPLMYQQNSLQMEWCLNCHRNPAVNLRPTSEIYNMAWSAPTSEKPVWCASGGVTPGVPTAQTVNCITADPAQNPEMAAMQAPEMGLSPGKAATASDAPPAIAIPAKYEKFTSQQQLGQFLLVQYHVRTPNELSSCEVCHR